MTGEGNCKPEWVESASSVARGIRRQVLAYTLKNNGGYLSQACSSAEILAVLYTRVMNLGRVEEPIAPGRFAGVPGSSNEGYRRGSVYNGPQDARYDRFILSPTHYSLVLYATLCETGRMRENGLSQFNLDGGILEMIGAEHSPGMEVMTGSLGQGISQAAGIAQARKLKGETGKVWVFMSDGELQPGQVWEALQAMSFFRLDNVGIYVDVNGYQCDGPTRSVMEIEPIDRRFAAFGCHVHRVDGHDMQALADASRDWPEGKPLAVICDTVPWQGIDALRFRAPKFHYIRFPDPEERKLFEAALTALAKGG